MSGVEAVYADVWTSMGREAEADARRDAFRGFTVDARLMRLASKAAIFLHCLPAHRGEEVTDDVLDGPASRVWAQAANRLHTETALLYAVLTGGLRGSVARVSRVVVALGGNALIRRGEEGSTAVQRQNLLVAARCPRPSSSPRVTSSC